MKRNPGLSPTLDAELTAAQRIALGKSLRKQLPREAHREWAPASDRPSVVEFMRRDAEDRVPALLPIRYERMAESPFTFFRGAASTMAFDLGPAPSTGIYVQLGGDSHLKNFGVFGSPTGRLLFDINDFDETLPGPWEYDVKRLAASVTVAARANGFDELQARTATLGCVRSYRQRIAEYAALPMLTVWYEHINPAALVKALPPTERVGTAQAIKKAKARHDLHVAAKLTSIVDGKPKLIDQPPLVEHGPFENLDDSVVQTMLSEYKQTLLYDRRQLLDRFLYADFARKVVGVGSVGTQDYIVLFEGSGGTGDDPLILQLKQATTSCLEPYFGAAGLENHAERVVNGQRVAQAASDILLGWSHNPETGRCFYWRQFRDHKASFEPAEMNHTQLATYSAFCGWSLARSHARSGAACRICGYLGTSSAFDKAVTDFAALYADQMETDHTALVKAVKSGELA